MNIFRIELVKNGASKNCNNISMAAFQHVIRLADPSTSIQMVQNESKCQSRLFLITNQIRLIEICISNETELYLCTINN